MRVGAVIAEYNPLHNGHAYQLADFKAKSAADYIIVIMSGDFVQRGEPAVFDKYTRAQMALSCGADMVVELPVYYAMSCAQRFARGAIGIFNAALKNADVEKCLGFGAERTDVNELRQAVKHYDRCTASDEFKTKLSAGVSFPNAAQQVSNISILKQQNCVLGMEYLRALDEYSMDIPVFITPRVGAAHGDSETTNGAFASSAYIRQHPESMLELVPSNLESKYQSNFVTEDSFATLILYSLSRMSVGDMERLPEMREGLHNKLFTATRRAATYRELLTLVKSKRYTMAAIKRSCFHALLGITSDVAVALPEYIHVLGITERARPLLSAMSETSSLPVIAGGNNKQLCGHAQELYDIDVFAHDTYSRAVGIQPRGDYVKRFIIVSR